MKKSMKARRFLIASFDGWNDACQAATNTTRHLLDLYASREIGHICGDSYYDFQMNRPMMCVVQGRKQIIWPETTVYEVAVDDDSTIYVAMGPEPNFHWSDYCQRLLRFADECDVTDVITLGSMYSDCTHTRALPIGITDGDDETVTDEADAYTGPVGIPTVLMYSAAEDGFDAHSLWVSIPQYLGGDDCPAGTLRLVEELAEMTDLDLDEGNLATQSERWRRNADMLMRCNDDLADYVRHVEQMMDREESERDLAVPHAKRLVEETEEFLRSFDHPAAPTE